MSGPVLPPPPQGPPPGQQPWPGHYGPASYAQQPGGPQPPWPTTPPPPRGGGNRRWLLLALAFLAVIAVSVALTTWLTHRGSGNQAGSSGGGSSSSGSSSEIASANDTGPVGIITEEPTCDRLLAMQSQVTAQLADWNKRDASIPASAWTPEQRQVFETAARVYRGEADQLVPLARDTPHRVIREIYEQIIAYDRAYADAIPHYVPADDDVAVVRNALSAAQFNICQAIASFAAANRGPSVPSAAGPTAVVRASDLSKPQRFLSDPSVACPKLSALLDKEENELELWTKTDPNVPASQRSTTDNILYEAAAKVLDRDADALEQIARSSGNPVMEDFLVLSAQYYRAYVAAIPTYVPADQQLQEVGQKSRVAVWYACKTVGQG